MNIYKISQDTFDFYNVMPETKQKSIEESSEYKDLDARTQNTFQELLNEIQGRSDLIKMLKMYNVKWNQTPLGFIVILGSHSYKIDNFEHPLLQRVDE